eukprot:CAMPEP_0184487452 /NCGR_PEP_ID=MMETSP0113_2-20130426/10122_1 /TAXON_ID=91329 /ORGANISM="Norrisiella sphaerica, Strain BC52" /LENGTH=317 /DNA_ID=CAMNT_0026869777 /DNA_START=181 /DNA_END=1131 /DNA_ORIENTATION=+
MPEEMHSKVIPNLHNWSKSGIQMDPGRQRCNVQDKTAPKMGGPTINEAVSAPIVTKSESNPGQEPSQVPFEPPAPAEGDFQDRFCRGTNELFKQLVVPPLRGYAEIRPARVDPDGKPASIMEKLLSPPEYPGVSRPVWLTILGSVPTGLLWYGWYKFSVEAELYEDSLRREGRATSCGGYGTLLPFVFLFLAGLMFSKLPPFASTPELAEVCFQAGAAWILIGQINLYRRVNELCKKEFGGEAPLHPWWALLPPPLDVVVGLRQVHFLSKYWASVRGEKSEKDVIAEDYFPFISSERFSLEEFVRQPRRWFWFTKEW